MENKKKNTQGHLAKSSCLKHVMGKSCIEIQADHWDVTVARLSRGGFS